MNSLRRKKLQWCLFFLTLFGLVIALSLYALKQNINLFFSPSQVVAGEAVIGQKIRLGGMVAKGSVIRVPNSLAVQFVITDYNHHITVNYEGILPDLFREEQGIVALGELRDKHLFIADEVLAKHDANYMPPEVKEALVQASRLQDNR